MLKQEGFMIHKVRTSGQWRIVQVQKVKLQTGHMGGCCADVLARPPEISRAAHDETRGAQPAPVRHLSRDAVLDISSELGVWVLLSLTALVFIVSNYVSSCDSIIWPNKVTHIQSGIWLLKTTI